MLAEIMPLSIEEGMAKEQFKADFENMLLLEAKFSGYLASGKEQEHQIFPPSC